MRVVHIIPSLDWGSAERQLRFVMRELPAGKFEQRLIVLRGKVADGDPLAARIMVLDWPSRIDLSSCHRLRRCVLDLAPDIVHAWRSEANRLVAATCQGVTARRVASLWRWRSRSEWLARALDYAALLPLSARLAPAWMESNARFANAQYTPVTYGVEADNDTDRRRQHRAELCHRLGIPNDTRLVGFVGPLLRESRVKDAIWAGDLLKVLRDDVHVLIVGYGLMMGRLQAFRRQVQIEDRVHFVSDPRRIDAALDALECIWITSQTAIGMPVLLEAMARGIPVIATDLPCHRRYLLDQRTGFIVNVGHRAGFARQTARLLDDPNLTRQLASAARASIAKRCAVPQAARQYADLYQRLCS